MKLIIGGAFQGKADYAKATYGGTVSRFEEGDIDFSSDIIGGIENFILREVKEGGNPVAFFEGNKEKWKDKVLICEDISQGIVPMDKVLRKWREENGKVLRYLAGEAEEVTRVFCGLGQRIK